MKKIIIGLFCILFSLFFVSCGPSDDGGYNPDNDKEEIDPNNPDNQTFIVTIDEDNGKPVRQETYRYGQQLSIEDPIKEGFRFLYWETEDGMSIHPQMEIFENLSIKAIYQQVFNIKFVMEEFGESSIVTFKDDTIRFPDIPIEHVEECRIDYWYTLDEEGNKIKVDDHYETKVTKDETYYAFILQYAYLNEANITYRIENNEATIYSFYPINSIYNNSAYYNFPDEINGHKVTKIDKDLYLEAKKHMNLFLPKYLKEIPVDIFDGLGDIDFISIPKTITKIPENILTKEKNVVAIAYEGSEEEFNLIDKASDFYLGEPVKVLYNRTFETVKQKENSYSTYYLIDRDIVTNITINKRDFFSYKDYLKNPTIFNLNNIILAEDPLGVELPECVTEIKDGIFEECLLKSIELPKTLKKIGNYAFAYTDMKTIVLPESLEYIGDFAFRNNQFETLNIPKNVKHIGKGFIAASSQHIKMSVDPLNKYFIEDKVNKIVIDVANNAVLHGYYNSIIPETVKNIAPYALYGGLEDKESFDHIEKIGEYALRNANFERSAKFTNLVEIGDDAFREAHGTNLVFGNVKKIGSRAFLCSKFKSVSFDSRSIYKIKNKCLFDDENKAVITGWEGFSIPTDTKIIRQHAFGDTSLYGNIIDITYLEIPASVEIIEEFAFANQNISYLKLNEGLKVIGDNAFYGLNADYISLPSTLESIGRDGISLGSDLKYLYIPKLNVTDFGLNIYFDGVSKTDIRFEGNKEEFEKLASLATSNVDLLENTKYNATDTLEFIKEDDCAYVKNGNNVAQYINLDMSAVYVNLERFNEYDSFALSEFAFYNHHDLEEVYFPNKLKVISRSSFNGCFSLKNVILPEGLERIENDAFTSSSDGTYIYIPKSVTYIGDYNDGDTLYLGYQGSEEEFNKITINSDKFKNAIKYFGVNKDSGRLVIEMRPSSYYFEYRFLIIDNHVELFTSEVSYVQLDKIIAKYPNLIFDADSFAVSNNTRCLVLPAYTKIDFNILQYFPSVTEVVIPSEVRQITVPLENKFSNETFYLEHSVVPMDFVDGWNCNNTILLAGEWKQTPTGPTTR